MNKKYNMLVILFLFLFLLFGIVRVNGIGVAYTEFACQEGRPVMMYPGEERDVTLWLKNSDSGDEKVRVKIVSNEAGIANLREGDYLVRAKTYDQTIKVNLKMPGDAILGQKYNVLINFYDIPNGEQGGISLTTAMNVNICLQVGEYVAPALSPEEGISNATYIILSAIALVILVAIVVWLILRKKK